MHNTETRTCEQIKPYSGFRSLTAAAPVQVRLRQDVLTAVACDPAQTGQADQPGRKAGAPRHGQQQQLAIGRAMILVLDELTEGIQPNIIQQIGRVIEDLRGRGDMAIIPVEQYFDLADALADRFYVPRRGAVALSGTRAEIPEADLRAAVSV
jgi:ABC-type branched-subunit amino acid transport system ATPase component